MVHDSVLRNHPQFPSNLDHEPDQLSYEANVCTQGGAGLHCFLCPYHLKKDKRSRMRYQTKNYLYHGGKGGANVAEVLAEKKEENRTAETFIHQ